MPSLVSKDPGAPSSSSNSSARRNSSKFALGKHRKQKSSLSDIKVDLHESHAEKEARRLKSYADPNMAVSQLEPAAMALEQSTMHSLFLKQHQDLFGNAIVDPDLSNPTRHRLERPLDTIRSFEAAIEDSYYTRRTSYGSRNNDQQGSTHNHRYGYASNPDVMTSTTSAHPQAPRRPGHQPRPTYDSTTSSPTSSHPDEDDASARGGAVQAPNGNGPYGYSNSGTGASRSRHLVAPPQYLTPPTSQAGMAWASAPARVAPPRKAVDSGPADKKKGWFRRKLGRKD